MNIFWLSWKNLMGRPLSAFISLLLIALGVGLISLLLQLNARVENQFEKNIASIDMVVGAKGSPMQLILASVLHVEDPTGNIPLSEARTIMKNPMVSLAVPVAFGDNYKGWRIVGTSHEYLEIYDAELKSGSKWDSALQVVLGAEVSAAVGLKIGDRFKSSHGLLDDHHVHHSEYSVAGILKSTGTVADQLILTSLESVWNVHDEEEGTEITALLVKFRNALGTMTVSRQVNEGTVMQAAVPAFEISKLYENLGIGMDTVRALAWIIIFVAGISVFASLYQALSDRKYEIAVMRAMGAQTSKLFGMVMLEALILGLLGYISGILLSRLALWVITSRVASNLHYQLDGKAMLPAEQGLILAVLLTCAVAALIPAVRTVKIDVSDTLSQG